MDILVLEDCIDTYNLIKLSLLNYDLAHAKTIKEAKKLLGKEIPLLMLLDLQLPDGNRADFCAELTQNPYFKSIPKIILTAKQETSNKVFGLYSRADDYVTKPFISQELRARCETKINKTRTLYTENCHVGDFQFDCDFSRLIISNSNGELFINLTPTEFKILFLLANNEGRSMERSEIIRKIWQQNGTTIKIRGLDTHVCHIRRKLGVRSNCLVSVYGKGYTFIKKHPEIRKIS